MKEPPPNPRLLVDTVAGGFVQEFRTFGVGVAVGLAPFFGDIPIPIFRPLIKIFPTDLKVILLTLAPFLVGLVAATVKFHFGQRVTPAKLSLLFGAALIAILAGVIVLVVIHNFYVVEVRAPDGPRQVITGSSRRPGCLCTKKGISDEECIKGLRFELDSCWDPGETKNIRLAFQFDYLLVNLGFGVLIGALRLKNSQPPPARRPARPSSSQEIEADPTTENRLPGTPAPPPPAATAAEHVVRPKPDRKGGTKVFDVFLCHNSADKPAVKKIGKQLEERGVLPWLDEWELPPGQPWQSLLEQQIDNIKSAAVFVGSAGVGPWQGQELRGFLSEFVSRKCPVIPVLLLDAPRKPKLPIFLKAMTWVDFRIQDPDPLDRLIWGITGKRPER